MTQPHPADAMLDHLGAVVTARQAGHDDIATDLLHAMVTDAESAFRVTLMLAQVAAFPTRMARQHAAEHGVTVIDIVPEVELLTEPEAIAMRLVAAASNDDREAAFDLALEVVQRVQFERPGPGGRFTVHAVITSLVDICAQGGPGLTAIPPDLAQQYAKREMN